MKAVSGKEMCKVHDRHGWQLARINGSHHIYMQPGNPAIVSVPVHGNRSLKVGIQRKITRDAGLNESDL